MYDTVDAKDTKKPDNHRNADQNTTNFSTSFFPKTYYAASAYKKHTAGKSGGCSRVCMPARAGIIQRQTMIEYEPGYYNYNYNPRSGGFGDRVTVGKGMCAYIDPNNSREGSTASAGGNTHMHLLHYLKNKWGTKIVRGHLLNDHLGGLSVEENLFPISAQANSNHLHKVEGYVKGFTYGRNREFIPKNIIYRVNVFNADGTQQFNEFNPMTQFCCDVEVYDWDSNAPKIAAHYDVDSDISNNTSNNDVDGPFGDNMPYTNNTGWRTRGNNLEPRPSNGNDYELKRQGEDVSMGIVHTGFAPYIKSAKDTKFKTKLGWGHMVEAIYSPFRQAVPDAMIESVEQEIHKSGDGEKIQDILDQCGARACCQNIARGLNIIQDGQTISDELYLQVCSKLIYHLWQDALTHEQEWIKDEAENAYFEKQEMIDEIRIGSENADAAKSELCNRMGMERPVSPRDNRYLSHIIHMAERHILDPLCEEIRLLLLSRENLEGNAFIRLAEVLSGKYRDFSKEKLNSYIIETIANSTVPIDSMLAKIYDIYRDTMMNADLLRTAIDSITEEIASEIKKNIIQHLTKCDEEQRWGDVRNKDGLNFQQVVLSWIMLNNDRNSIYEMIKAKGYDEVLLGRAFSKVDVSSEPSLSHDAVRIFLEEKIAAQEKRFADILFRICYGWLKNNLEQGLIDILIHCGKYAFLDLTTVYKVLMKIVNEKLVKESRDDSVFLSEELSEDAGLDYFINTTMADYDWFSSPESAKDQIYAKSDDEQNQQIVVELFRNYFQESFPLKQSLFEKIVYRMAFRWTYERLGLNEEDDGGDYTPQITRNSLFTE